MRANGAHGASGLRRRAAGRRVTLAAGECGVKDQVSRTQPQMAAGTRRRLRGPPPVGSLPHERVYEGPARRRGQEGQALAESSLDRRARAGDAGASATTPWPTRRSSSRSASTRARRLDDLLIEAYAVTREAAWRVLGQRHFDVQLMGGMALHFGWIAEMKTGEGKTLVSTLPAYLNALDGEGVHMVTVNEYLATRDSEWMGRVHRWLGLTVGRIGAESRTVRQAGGVRGGRHLRHELRVRLRLPARQHGARRGTTWRSGATSSPSSTRSTPSSSTRRARR